MSETIKNSDDLKEFEIILLSKKHKDFKEETEKLEGPGQFLRHYAPNIDSYLFTGEFSSEVDLKKAVIIDFGGILSGFRDKAMHYVDMSA